MCLFLEDHPMVSCSSQVSCSAMLSSFERTKQWQMSLQTIETLEPLDSISWTSTMTAVQNWQVPWCRKFQGVERHFNTARWLCCCSTTRWSRRWRRMHFSMVQPWTAVLQQVAGRLLCSCWSWVEMIWFAAFRTKKRGYTSQVENSIEKLLGTEPMTEDSCLVSTLTHVTPAICRKVWQLRWMHVMGQWNSQNHRSWWAKLARWQWVGWRDKKSGLWSRHFLKMWYHTLQVLKKLMYIWHISGNMWQHSLTLAECYTPPETKPMSFLWKTIAPHLQVARRNKPCKTVMSSYGSVDTGWCIFLIQRVVKVHGQWQCDVATHIYIYIILCI